MFINLGYLRGQMRLRNPEFINKSDNLGSMLKHHRLKLNLTLEDSSDGICSVSYLSKIENSLIRPSQKYLLLFEEKYNTNFNDVETKHHELLLQIIENIFHGCNEELDPSIFYDDNYQAKLNEYGYLISQRQYTEARTKMKLLNPYIKNLNDLELKFYVYATAKLLTHEGRMRDAFSMLYVQTQKHNNLFLDLLIKSERLYLATQMNHHPYIGLSYENLVDKLIENEFYHKVHDIKFHHMSYLVQFIHAPKLDELISKSQSLENHEKNYLTAKHHFHNMSYDLAYELLENQSYDDIGSYELLLLTLNRLDNKKVLKEKLCNSPKNGNKHFDIITKYLKLKTKPIVDTEEVVNFIQTEILKGNDLPDNALYLSFWYEEGLQYFKKIGYYKDATTLGHLILRKTKDLMTIFD